MRLSLRHVVVGLALTATLTACGGSSSDDSSDDAKPADDTATSAAEPTAEPASGDTIEGTGYTYNVPEGWSEPKQEIAGTGQADSLAADLDDKDGFADNVNVVRQDPTPGELTDGIEDTLTSQLSSSGAKDVEAQERATVAGDEAVHITSAQATNLSDQYYVVHDGVLYVVTFSYSKDVSQDDQDETAASVLGSWEWAA